MLRHLIQALLFVGAGCYQLPSLAQGSLFSSLSPPILSERGICSNLLTIFVACSCNNVVSGDGLLPDVNLLGKKDSQLC